jgi:plastocyanin
MDLRQRPLAVTLTCAVLALAGCGGKTTSPHGRAPATGGTTITIKNFQYRPASLTVSPGAKVTVINKDDTVPHTVTSTRGKAFDTGTIPGGQIATFTAPTARGTYAYFCTIHPYMHGTLMVT